MFLWLVQGLIAVTFIWAGVIKLLQPKELPWEWVEENPRLVSISALFDLLAGVGLTLPGLLRILPKLTIYAAYGTIALMLAAIVFHIWRGEGAQIGFNVFIVILAVFIAWGRRRELSGKLKKYNNK